MKRVILYNIPFNKELTTFAMEHGAYAIWVDEKDTDKVKALGNVRVIANNGDIKPGENIALVEINNKEDENKAAAIGKRIPVCIKANDWKVIPLENLIAQVDTIYTFVNTFDEARLAMETLEKGADGVVVHTTDINELERIFNWIDSLNIKRFTLQEVEITNIKPIGMGDRVCIDTISLMETGEGMLVGSSGNALFLVHAETEHSPYVASRPFRVNAGAIHAYIKAPDKTPYLSDLKSGDEVYIINHKGEARVSYIGRLKIEKRPMLYIEAKTKSGKVISHILQNAETIRLTSADGKPISVAVIKPNDKVLAYIDEGGHHFGMKVNESIIEK